MRIFIEKIILAAADEEAEIWPKLLIITIIAAVYGLYTLIKAKTEKNKIKTLTTHLKTNPEPIPQKPKRNLAPGMEILELNFLIRTIEETKSNSENEKAMRVMCFKEIIRRKCLNAIDSRPLRYYALNSNSSHGKLIQCEAMKELTNRTKNIEHKKTDLNAHGDEKGLF